MAGLCAFITGGGSGIGRAAALALARCGVRVTISDRDAAAAAAVAAAILAAGGQARSDLLDVSDGDAIARAVQAAAAAFGQLDIVVNNAGIGGFFALDAPDYDERFQTMLTVLLTAQQRVVRAALPHLRQSANPRIVNIASTEALGATRHDSAYAAAKAGVAGLTRAMAVDLGPEGITANCICPGPVLTGMTAAIPAEARAVFARRRTALGRYAEPSEIANVIVSLCQPGASFLTGAVIPVDGGLTARNG